MGLAGYNALLSLRLSRLHGYRRGLDWARRIPGGGVFPNSYPAYGDGCGHRVASVRMRKPQSDWESPGFRLPLSRVRASASVRANAETRQPRGAVDRLQA
jgi:hypothetical protein